MVVWRFQLFGLWEIITVESYNQTGRLSYEIVEYLVALNLFSSLEVRRETALSELRVAFGTETHIETVEAGGMVDAYLSFEDFPDKYVFVRGYPRNLRIIELHEPVERTKYPFYIEVCPDL